MLINTCKFINALLQLIPGMSDLTHARMREMQLLWLHVTSAAVQHPTDLHDGEEDPGGSAGTP